MLIPKTHFEQVSLAIVRKIVEEQIQEESATKQDQEAKKNSLREDYLQWQRQSMGRHRPVSIEEL
jgi:hypothetical protein